MRSLQSPLWLLCLAPLLFSACDKGDVAPAPSETTVVKPSDNLTVLEGKTMGTTWTASYRATSLESSRIQGLIQASLDSVDNMASTWKETSELSRLNKQGAGHPFAASAELAGLIRMSLLIAERSGGAFDPTMGALLSLYGFGAQAADRPPTPAELKVASAKIGHTLVTVDAKGAISKARSDVNIDLSAIAKGYGVDRAAAALNDEGLKDFMLEVGGEIVTKGHRPDGSPWRVGIENPTMDKPGSGGNAAVALLSNRALATSGDYRQFRLEGAGRVHHIIDPRLGTSAVTELASVTVVAPDCTLADALATAIMVMGPKEGVPFAETWGDEVEVFWMTRNQDGTLSTGKTDGFPLAGKAAGKAH